MRTNLNDLFIREAFTRAFAAMPRGERLLDLGCGLKPYAPLYESRFAQCVAADYAPRRPDISVCVDAQSLPFADASFDAVILSEVIEHLPHPSAALAEIARVMRPGGTLVLSWPMHYGMHETPWDYVRITEFGMQAWCRAAGLEIAVLGRRGDAFAVALEIASHLAGGASEALRRLPGVGRLFAPLAWLVERLSGAAARVLHALQRDAARLHPGAPGGALGGVGGQLARWTLGYCAVVRKPGQVRP